ncbi:MAG TPA: hypothetical protein VF483_00680 [Gemmatimonadaceae bacterium]
MRQAFGDACRTPARQRVHRNHQEAASGCRAGQQQRRVGFEAFGADAHRTLDLHRVAQPASEPAHEQSRNKSGQQAARGAKTQRECGTRKGHLALRHRVVHLADFATLSNHTQACLHQLRLKSRRQLGQAKHIALQPPSVLGSRRQ